MASKPSKLKITIQSAIVVGGLALVMALPAAAVLRINTTAGTSCKGSSGFGATLFYFSNQTAENTSGSGQYLTCEVPTVFPNVTTTPLRVEALFYNPTDADTQVTCALQSGYEVGASAGIVTTAIYNITVPAGDIGNLDASPSSTPVIPPSPTPYTPYTLSCLVPAANKMGVIAVRSPGVLGPDV
jgi:hypothetical protein